MAVWDVSGVFAIFSRPDITGAYSTAGGAPKPEKVNLELASGIKSIACGSYHMAAITHDGQLYTWYVLASISGLASRQCSF